jgi:hypothetical protein
MSYRFVDSFRNRIGMELVPSWSCCSKAVYKPVWHIPLLSTVKNSWWWAEELSETCRVSFQNKFEKLVHLVGFIIRIRHDVRSHERKKVCQFRYGVGCHRLAWERIFILNKTLLQSTLITDFTCPSVGRDRLLLLLLLYDAEKNFHTLESFLTQKTLR